MARAASATSSPTSRRSRRRRRWLPTWKELLVVVVAVALGALAAWLTRPGGPIDLGMGPAAVPASPVSSQPSGSAMSAMSAIGGPN